MPLLEQQVIFLDLKIINSLFASCIFFITVGTFHNIRQLPYNIIGAAASTPGSTVAVGPSGPSGPTGHIGPAGHMSPRPK